MLQSVDYLPVFHHEEVSSDRKDTVVDGDTAVQPLYGSDLLKKSLEVTRKRIMFASKGNSNVPYTMQDQSYMCMHAFTAHTYSPFQTVLNL